MSTSSGNGPDSSDSAQGSPLQGIRQRPLTVWILFLVLFGQGIAVLGSAALNVINSSAQVLDVVGQVMLVVLYVLAAAAFMVLGVKIFQGSAGARTPAMVMQFMMVVLSFSFFASGLVMTGLIFLLPAGLTLVLLFAAPTQNWLTGSPTVSSRGGA